MIQPLIENLWTSLECLDLFEKIFPLVEQKEGEEKTYLESYVGNGNYEHVQNFDSYNGLAYFRLTSDVETESKENDFRACDILINSKYVIRLVCCIRRSELPNDCAFSDDGLGWLLVKELTGRGGSLKQSLGANSVLISAGKIITDRKKLLSDEFPGDKIPDINYEYSYIGVDFTVTIEIRQSCIEALCDTYYTPAGSCTPRVISNGQLKTTDPMDTVAGVYSYTVNIPANSTLSYFILQNLTGASNDATLTYLTATTSTFTITNTDNFVMDQVYKLVIAYK